MNRQNARPPSLSLYLTGEQPCSYLPGRQARSLFVDPLARMDGSRYRWLLAQGFRRSGRFIYRPACRGCRRCVAVRIPVSAFTPDRAQRRCAQRNADLHLVRLPAVFLPEHFVLYRAYLAARHPDGEMAEGDAEDFQRFLLDPWGGDTELFELRLRERLIAVAITDVVPGGLSAIYTFFDPGELDRSPGTFALLNQVAEARRRGLDHVYLGFWIEDCRKMRYKEHFRPLEAWDGLAWRRYERSEPIPTPPDGAGR
ncbi:putative arginyl-tRNA:protein arginylyltransferase [Thioflavicoccus mobilis 8321]|uniref:Aspartate/glutamate leucyltransferase n=1 Tax=Thioflavicoccus mobilis 8321 TaxID=765912 RepID=L0GWP6_9GAMM|nr:arginyltransferase [Thioflavicoccus mobilis]AGA91183.1 putative arginyl-tRNA:protein arginylyltransferase [Thioflavicoccus mobilis 8321]